MIKLKFDHIKTAPYLDVEKNTSNSGFRLMFLDESSVEISNKKKTGGQNTLLHLKVSLKKKLILSVFLFVSISGWIQVDHIDRNPIHF